MSARPISCRRCGKTHWTWERIGECQPRRRESLAEKRRRLGWPQTTTEAERQANLDALLDDLERLP